MERNEMNRSINRPSFMRQNESLKDFALVVRAKGSKIHLRTLRATDRGKIRKVLKDLEAFTPEEISVAVSLVDEALNGSTAYRFLVATDEHDLVLGYICYGPAPMTSGTWDVYWIAVSRGFQRRHIGSLLLRCAEIEIRTEGGTLIVIETSSRPSYDSARKFYEKMGYHVSTRIAEFYSEEDDKVTYCKDLASLRKARWRV